MSQEVGCWRGSLGPAAGFRGSLLPIHAIRAHHRLPQGFPDQHRFKGSVADCYKQVGNAVPPPLALALGLQLRQALALRQQGHRQAEGKEEERQQVEEEGV